MLSSLKGLANHAADSRPTIEDEVRHLRNKLAEAQGEIEGYVCKLSGFKKVVVDLEMQLAEKDLQLAMLKSFIRDSEDHQELKQRFTELLEINMQLNEQLQEANAAAAAAAAAATASIQTSREDSSPWCYNGQLPSWNLAQMAMLRKALTVANMRLTAAGIMPVAATNDLLQQEDADSIRSVDQSVPFVSPMPSGALHHRPSSSTSHASGHSSRHDRATPELPPLSLYRRLSNVNVDGTGTPSAAEALRTSPSSRCSSPSEELVGSSTEGRAVATVATVAACASKLEAAVVAAAQIDSSAGTSSSSCDAEDGDLLSSDEEELGGVYVDNGWKRSSSSLDLLQLPVKDNPLYAVNTSPDCSPQRQEQHKWPASSY